MNFKKGIAYSGVFYLLMVLSGDCAAIMSPEVSLDVNATVRNPLPAPTLTSDDAVITTGSPKGTLMNTISISLNGASKVCLSTDIGPPDQAIYMNGTLGAILAIIKDSHLRTIPLSTGDNCTSDTEIKTYLEEFYNGAGVGSYTMKLHAVGVSD